MARALAATVLALGIFAAVQDAAMAEDGRFTPVTDEMLENPPPADWLMWRRTLDSWGYSPLTEITTDNVASLRMVWARPLSDGSQEGTPLVHEGVMYFPEPGDVVSAIDAKSGAVLWRHRRDLPDDISDHLPVHDTNRNLAIYGNLLIDTSADDYLYALDARTGEQVWETKIMDYRQGAKQSSGPIIANGLAITGRSCEPEGGPDACVITAHDARTGEEVWRTSTIARGDDPNSASWGDVPVEERRHVGAWMIPSYDPELNLIYMGTSVTAPAPKIFLAGNDRQYLYHNSTLALDADTGEIVWHYQHLVDHWDLDHPFERVLLDTQVAPDPEAVPWINPDIDPDKEYKVLTGVPGKTGVIYTLDRETGEFLWARPTIRQNVVQSIDGKTGAVQANPETVFTEAGEPVFVCPSAGGGNNFMAGAYSPKTEALYMPAQNTCATVTAITPEPGDGIGLYAISTRQQVAPGTTDVGTIHAVSARTGRTLWKYEQRAGMMSLLTTAGGLLFSGDADGRFRAMDQETGDILWEINLGSSVAGYPASFEVDGHQYIAVSTGRWLNDVYTPELIHGTQNTLFVFALPDAGIGAPGPHREPRAANPRVTGIDPAGADAGAAASRSVLDGVYTAEQAEQGASVYAARCVMCHGENYEGAPGSPPVAGSAFLANWQGQTLSALYDYLKESMPPGQAGALSDADYLATVSLLLKANGFPEAEEGALSTDRASLADVLIESQAQAAAPQ